MSARKVAREFFDHMQAGDVDEILSMLTPDAAVSLVPLSKHGSMGPRARTTCMSWPGPSPTW